MTFYPNTAWRDILAKGIGHLFPGAALAVGGADRETVTCAVGRLAPWPGSPPVKHGTLFDLSSLSKVLFTTSIMARLVDRGRFSLDDRVREAWPELPWADPWKNISFRHVLAHCAGFPAWRDYSGRSKSEILKAIVTERPSAEPGEKTIYSDLGFILLSSVLEHAMGCSWLDLCEAEVIAPLGLVGVHSSPILFSRISDGVAVTLSSCDASTDRVEVHDTNARALGGISGHAGFFADLSTCITVTQEWLDAIDGRGSFLSKRVAGEFATRWHVKKGEARALGWDVPTVPHSTAGKKVSARSIGHLGFTGTSVWIDLVRKSWVILLTNRTSMETSVESMREFRAALHDAVWEWMDK